MKIESLDPDGPRPDLPRRRLLLGLPAGMVTLAAPMWLAACGGGSSTDEDTEPPPSGGIVDLHDPGRAFVGTEAAVPTEVTVTLPAGVTVPDGRLAAHTLIGGFGVVSAGKASLPLAFGGMQLASVYTRDGLPVLCGYVDSRAPGTLDSTSTAVALVASALAAPVFEEAVLVRWLAEIAASDAIPPLATAIEAELRRDVYALASYTPAIATAVESATRKLLADAGAPVTTKAAKGTPRREGVTVNPAGERSGVEPILGATLNSVHVRNAKLRRAFYTIRRESSTDSAGTVTRDPARTVVASGDIPMLPAFSGASSIIGAVTTAAYNGADADGNPDTSLAYSQTAEAVLALVPETAKSTLYSVTVLTAGNGVLGFDATWASQNLTAEELAKVDITQMSTAHLGLQQMFVDILLPIFQSWIGAKVAGLGALSGTGQVASDNRGKVALAVLGEMVKVLQSTLPSLYTKMATDPAYGPAQAIGEIVQKHLVTLTDLPVAGRNVTVPMLTPFSIKILLLLVKWFAYEKMDVPDAVALIQFLEGHGGNEGVVKYTWGDGLTAVSFDANTVAHAGLAVAAKALATVDMMLGNLNNARIVGDMLTSKLIETWELKVGKANVKLTPTPLKVDKVATLYPVKAEIVDNDNDDYGNEKGSWRFDWVCSAQHGDLFKPLLAGQAEREMNRFSTSNLNATCDYVARKLPDDDAAAETITVQAWFEPIGASQPPILVGKATCTVEFAREFSVKTTPLTAELPTGGSLSVSARLVEPVPAGASVRYEWQLVSGTGSLTAAVDGADLATSLVTYQAAADETTANVQVTAVVALAGGRVSRTHPAKTTISVKKNLKTLQVEGNWVYEPGLTPVTPPQCFIDGVGKESCHLGRLDDWVVYQVPKVAGALSYDIRILTPTGGIRQQYFFPVGSGVTDAGGLLRIKYWALNSPYGSYDGVSNLPQVQANAVAYLLGRVAQDGPRVVATVTMPA